MSITRVQITLALDLQLSISPQLQKASKLVTKSLQFPIHSNFFRELQFTEATQGSLEFATFSLGITSF